MLIRKTQLRPVEHPVKRVSEDMVNSLNTYSEYVDPFIEGGVVSGDTGLETTMTETEVKEMLASPESNLEGISNLIYYYYISGGDIFQLFTLFKTLPALNYKIGAFDNTIKRYDLSMSEIRKAMYKISYKEITRDIISQVCLDGGVVTMWCGNKKSPYLYVFENLRYVFPTYRVGGEWQCVIDMDWFSSMEEEERLAMFTNLSPYVTETQFNAYKNDTQDKTKQYIVLPQDRTTYIIGNHLRRNQRMGIPLGTQALLDILHKETLKNLEKAISNRVIKNIGVLTIGNDEEGKSFVDIDKGTRRVITSGVAKALKQNQTTDSGQIPIVTLPEFCKLDFNKIDGLDALKSEKFENIAKDLSNDTGVSSALTTGSGSNFAGASLNLQVIYQRVAEILEQIEKIYVKMFKLILPKNVAENFTFEFDKGMPLDKAKELDILMQLEAQGFSVKAVIDMLSSISFDDYLEQTEMLTNDIKIQDLLQPPKSTYTLGGDEGTGESTGTPTNENTVASETSGGNDNPEPAI